MPGSMGQRLGLSWEPRRIRGAADRWKGQLRLEVGLPLFPTAITAQAVLGRGTG